MDLARSLGASPRSGHKRYRGTPDQAQSGKRTALLAAIVLALFALFGGSGAPFPALLLPLEVLGLLVLGALLYRHLCVRRIALPIWPGGVLIGSLIVVIALQFLPVPWSFWQALPGRELAVASLKEAGLDGGWRALAIAPAHTRSAAITLLPAIAIFLLATALSFEQRMQLLKIAVGVATASALLGLLQFLLPGRPYLYLSPRAVFDLSSGVFANRNFQATFLLVAMITAPAALAASPKINPRVWLPALFTLFSLGVLATKSRYGFVGLVLTLPAAVYTAGLLERRGERKAGAQAQRAAWAGRAGTVAIFLGLAALGAIFFATVMLERFDVAATADKGSELRLAALPDLLLAMRTFFPLGSGLGSFEPVYRLFESLEIVSPPYFNHAHNDYIELIIELGIIGAALPMLFVLACFNPVRRTIAAARSREQARSGQRQQHLAMVGAAGGLALMLGHSFADYPLRTITLECMFALLTALLLVPAPAAVGGPPSLLAHVKKWRIAVAAAIAVAVIAGSVVIARTQIARQAVQAKAGPTAYMADPSNPDALALQAELFFAAGQMDRATTLAKRAVDAFPLKPTGLRVLGLVRNSTQPGRGDPALSLAAELGWRDLPVQAWVLERAMLSGQWRAAMLRAEAMTRLGASNTTTFGMMSMLSAQPSARERLVASLSEKPVWRRQFLTNDDPRTPQQRAGMKLLLEALSRGPTPPTLAEARPTIDGLARENNIAAAAALYRTVAAERRGTASNLLWDGGFSLAPAAYEPGPANSVFDWRVYGSDASFGAVEKPADHSQALILVGRAGADGRLAERLTTLLPGTYRIAWAARQDTPDKADGLRLIVRCANGREMLSYPVGRGLSDKWKRYSATFVVPASGCASQTLSFAASGVAPDQQPAVYLDDVVVRRAAAAP